VETDDFGQLGKIYSAGNHTEIIRTEYHGVWTLL
jgi:hypothetical protein